MPVNWWRVMNNNTTHLTQLLTDAARVAADKQALIGLDNVINYQQLYNYSLALAEYLYANTSKGVVAIMLPNLLSFPVSLFGAWYADRIATLINPLYTSDELLKQCRDAEVETIIVAKIFYKTLEPILKETKIQHVIIVDVGDLQPCIKRQVINLITAVKRKTYTIQKQDNVVYTTLNQILHQQLKQDLPHSNLNNKVALLQYTGGTSGILKAAKLTHQNILANISQLEQWIPPDIDNNSSILTALPLYHIFALTINCLLFVHLKGTNILILNPREIKQLITPFKKYSINVITGVNTLFGVLVRHKDFTKLNLADLKVAVSGGMPLDKDISDRWQSQTNKPIVQGYGLTECSPVVSAESYNTKEFSGSVGHPLVDTKIKILDAENNQAESKIGEICIKGPQVMESYWRKEKLNKKVFTKDGYFRSGDMGYIDEQGRIFIVDRVKDMIIVSGFNVYPIDVERVLNQHPEVVESACVGIEHKVSGQAIKAYVVKKPNSTLEKQILIKHCKQHLTHYKVPRQIQWIESLPKSNVGKILKRKLAH